MAKNNNTSFFSFLVSETRGIILLLVLCLILVGSTFWFKYYAVNTIGTETNITAELEAYLNSPIKKININTADSATLTSLKGIGPKTATNIINYRNEHGQFHTIYDLDSVKGIGLKTITSLDSFITTTNITD